MAPLTRSEVDNLQIGYATPCLGMNTAHTLEIKFKALQDGGFRCVELGFGNYVSWVRSKVDLPPSTCPEEWKVDDEPDPSDVEIWDALYSHTTPLKELAKQHGLELLILQPLNQFDGWPENHPRGVWVKRKAEKWLFLCSQLGVKYLQVGANDQAGQGAGDEKTAEDMRWLAELGARQENPVKIAYESWCFSPRVNNWEHCHEIIKLANHPNLGLCLDTAQMALSPVYGYDPETGQGYTDSQFKSLISRLKSLDPESIFFFEISEVLKPQPPLFKGSDFDHWAERQPENVPNLSHWVQCARSVPFVGKSLGKGVTRGGEEEMGGARVAEIAKAVFGTGFRGPVIWEIFEALEMEKDDLPIPHQYAQASQKSREILFEKVTV